MYYLHLFNLQCLKTWIESEISRNNPNIKCPSNGLVCKGGQSVIKMEEIENIVSHDFLVKHKSALMDLKIAKNKNLIWCPRPDCNTACNVTDGSTNAVCPTCFKDFCVRCLNDPHFESTCEEMIEDFTDLNVKECPTCSLPIQRNRGCRILTCSRCSESFCWDCSKPRKSCACKSTLPRQHILTLFSHLVCYFFIYRCVYIECNVWYFCACFISYGFLLYFSVWPQFYHLYGAEIDDMWYRFFG